MIPLGHKGGFIDKLRFSPNAKYLVSHSMTQGTYFLWETSTSRLIRTIRSRDLFFQFSPDGKYIAIGVDGNIEIQETNSGERVKNINPKVSMDRGIYPNDMHPIFSHDSKYCVIEDNGITNVIEITTGKVVRKIVDPNGAHIPYFSPDNKFIITTCSQSRKKIWENASGNLEHSIQGVTKADVWFSQSGKYVVTAVCDLNYNTVGKIWESVGKKPIQEFQIKGPVDYVFFHDDKAIVIESREETLMRLISTGHSIALTDKNLGFNDLGSAPIKKTNIKNGILIGLSAGGYLAYIYDLKNNSSKRIPYPDPRNVYAAELSPNAEHIAIARQDDIIEILETATGKSLSKIGGYINSVSSAEFDSANKHIITSAGDMNEKDSVVRIWDAATGRLVNTLKHNKAEKVRSSHFGHDGKLIITTNDNSVKIWETSTGILVNELPIPYQILHAATFSPNGKHIAATGYDEQGALTNVWDFSTKKKLTKDLRLRNFHKNDPHRIGAIRPIVASFSADGTYLLAAALNDTIKIWNISTGSLFKFLTHTNGKYAEFSPDGKYVITVGESIRIWEFPSGKLIHELRQASSTVSPKFSSDGTLFATAASDNEINIWETSTGKLLKKLKGHSNSVLSVSFSSDTKQLVSTSLDLSTRLWSIEKGEEILTWYSIGYTDWVVKSPSGLFDASSGGFDKLYFVKDLNTIDLNQLKERYYEPNLWRRLMNGKTYRDVDNIISSSLELPPDIQINSVDDKGYLFIELVNKGGGIGEVAIYIQGKEVIKDARDKDANPDAPSMKIKYYVSNHKNLTNGTNYIGVKAWNKNHWIESRSSVVSYLKGETEKNYRPSAHILVCGVSDYTGNSDIDLTYAAKDADDMGRALRLGATKLFGVQKSFVYNLSTTMPKESWPTKVNILNVFKKISISAHPLDIIIVYLSGHGINLGGENGDWYYLTQEAKTTSVSAYMDPTIRKLSTLSSTELVELFNTIPAAKQVLMIDACASGRVVDNLVTKRDIPSSTLRSLDRMKDRTGMHIITGCTADAVSYEASRYGQGLLTYSLLEGIRGAALKDDEFVDVNRLFQYAQERVPLLAEDIGGIQTPMVFSPNGSQSFDIGQLTVNEKKQIPISKVRKVYIQSNFQDEDEMSDVLSLGKRVDQLLSETSARGADAPIVFVPVREYPDGCQFVGRYKKLDGKIVLHLKKKCLSEDSIVEVTGTDLIDLGNKVVNFLN